MHLVEVSMALRSGEHPVIFRMWYLTFQECAASMMMS